MTKICGIYLITHIESGRKYVGQSRDIHLRWTQHAKGGTNGYLARAVSVHGWGAFSSKILELCEIPNLNEKEVFWILHHSCISPSGFNLSSGGKQRSVFTPDVLQRMSAAHMGKRNTLESIAKTAAANRGTKRTEEQRQRMSESAKKKVLPDSVREACRARVSAILHNPKTIAKAAAARVGLKRNPAAIAATALANTGRKHTAENLAKMRRPKSAEHRLKLSEIAKKRVITPERLAQLRALAAANIGRKLSPEHIAKALANKAANKLIRQSSSTATADLFA